MEFKGTKDNFHIVDGVNCKYIYRRPQRDLYEYNGNNGAGVAGDRPIATIHKGWSGEDEEGYPYEENAKLFGASKDLLEALEELHELLEENQDDAHFYLRKHHNKAQTAIQKALG